MTAHIVIHGDEVHIDTTHGDVTIPVSVTHSTSSGGIPLATEFRLPMKNVDLPWYNADTVYGPYQMWQPNMPTEYERMCTAVVPQRVTYHPSRCVDRNLETGGDTDFEEPLVAPFSGIIIAANDWYGRIGGVVQLMGVATNGDIIIWCGWHVRAINVTPGVIVDVGEIIAAIGNAHGVYAAHLHEQIVIVNKYGVPGPTIYPSHGQYGWQQPDEFYLAHGVDAATIERCKYKDGK